MKSINRFDYFRSNIIDFIAGYLNQIKKKKLSILRNFHEKTKQNKHRIQQAI